MERERPRKRGGEGRESCFLGEFVIFGDIYIYIGVILYNNNNNNKYL